jgi:hypothetical protein
MSGTSAPRRERGPGVIAAAIAAVAIAFTLIGVPLGMVTLDLYGPLGVRGAMRPGSAAVWVRRGGER